MCKTIDLPDSPELTQRDALSVADRTMFIMLRELIVENENLKGQLAMERSIANNYKHALDIKNISKVETVNCTP